MKKIIISFNTDGGTDIRAEGFTGAECLKATKSFEDALGMAGNSMKTSAYYAKTKTAQKQRGGTR